MAKGAAGGLEASGAIERILRLLTSVAEHGEFTLKDISDDAGIPASSAYRLLQSLGAFDFIEKSSPGSYRVSREFYRLASLIVDRFDLDAVARPFLTRMADRSHETCAFALYLPNQHAFMIVDTIGAVHPLQYVVEKFQPRSLFSGALGRSMLAFLPDGEVQAALEASEFLPAPGMPMPDAAERDAQMAAVREQGCFIAASPNLFGTTGTAAAVFDSVGRVVGSLGIAIPAVRYDPAMQPEISAIVTENAAALSEALGHRQGGASTTRTAAAGRPLRTSARRV